MKRVAKSLGLVVVVGPALVWALTSLLTLNFNLSLSDVPSVAGFVYMLAIGPALMTWLFDLLLQALRVQLSLVRNTRGAVGRKIHEAQHR
jgi:hypothetical protein